MLFPKLLWQQKVDNKDNLKSMQIFDVGTLEFENKFTYLHDFVLFKKGLKKYLLKYSILYTFRKSNHTLHCIVNYKPPRLDFYGADNLVCSTPEIITY